MEKTKDSQWTRGEPIGKGSFGTVSVGFDRKNGRAFAVKSVAVSSGTAAQLDAIENEIAVLRSLSSPYVVKYYSDDVTKEQTAVYRNLHMEYLPGGTVAELLKSGAGAAEEEEELVRRCTRCLVSALQYVHSRGIVHCDVKGKNVLLGASPGIAKLADFGSAKVVGDRRERIVPRGSPLWMAPEVVRGESQESASDVWALGCTVIEMVTGAPAWRDEGADTLCRIGYSDELPRFPTRLSGAGKDFLEKCLRKDPAKRWSCDQLLQHPFLCAESTVQIRDFSSPRSVIEWPRLELSDDDEEEESAWSSDAVRLGSERIGKLAGTAGANWESDGWVGVRGVSEVVVEDSYAGFSANQEAGASSVFSDSWGAKEEFDLSPSCSGGLSGGEGCVAVEENGWFSFIAVETPTSSFNGGESSLYFSPSILYNTNHLCYKNKKYSIFHVILFSINFRCLYESVIVQEKTKLPLLRQQDQLHRY